MNSQITVAGATLIGSVLLAVLAYVGRRQDTRISGFDKLNTALQQDNQVLRAEVQKHRDELDKVTAEVAALRLVLQQEIEMRQAMEHRLQKYEDAAESKRLL